MPKFIDDLALSSAFRMERKVCRADAGDVKFVATFTIESGHVRVVKEFDFSDHPEAVKSLRVIANEAFAKWLSSVTSDLIPGKTIYSTRIDVDHNGWASVVLRSTHDGLEEVRLDLPDSDDFSEMEISAATKLREILERALRRHEETWP